MLERNGEHERGNERKRKMEKERGAGIRGTASLTTLHTNHSAHCNQVPTRFIDSGRCVWGGEGKHKPAVISLLIARI